MPAPRPRAFTLVELLVVVSIVSLLIGLLLPGLSRARAFARRIACLANLRSIETAHWAYLGEHDGHMLGTSHGSSWVDTLRETSPALLLRSPVDTSPHFEDGTPLSGVFRETSYGLNQLLSPDAPEGIGAVGRLDMVMRPSGTVHSVIRAFEGPGAVADHVHPQSWGVPFAFQAVPKAATEIELAAHGAGGSLAEGVSAYGFLDGHAEPKPFSEIYRGPDDHAFDPRR